MRTITKQQLEQMDIRQDRLVICGAGHVSLAVIRLGILLGFFVTVIEDRPYFADQARRILEPEEAEGTKKGEVICEAFETALAGEKGSGNTYFVVVTRGHRYDLDCLKSILKKPYAYVGMMASRGRALRVRTLLLEDGFLQEMIDTLHSPIGLKINAKTPEEIAVSIMAEIIQVRGAQLQTSLILYQKGEIIVPGEEAGTIKEENDSDIKIDLIPEIKEAALSDSDMRRVLTVITARRGSAPRTIGTAMLVFADGRIAGTIGGGCLEAEVIREALTRLRLPEPAVLSDGQGQLPDRIEVQMLPEEAENEGMACGGILQVEFIEIKAAAERNFE
ncbi:MAG TPA: XdhC family protein [Lachnospiraceae bacterium]|nr:XdhC family protein [Lachnospiraceae bacterium]